MDIISSINTHKLQNWGSNDLQQKYKKQFSDETVLNQINYYKILTRHSQARYTEAQCDAQQLLYLSEIQLKFPGLAVIILEILRLVMKGSTGIDRQTKISRYMNNMKLFPYSFWLMLLYEELYRNRSFDQENLSMKMSPMLNQAKSQSDRLAKLIDLMQVRTFHAQNEDSLQ